VNSVLRPMSTSEILDRTFSLYRNNFLLLAGIALLPAALALLLHVIGVAAHITVPAQGRSAGETELLSFGYEALVIFIASIIGGGIASGATVYAIYHLHVGQPASISRSYKNVLASWFRVIVAAILVFLVVIVISGLAALAIIFGVFWPMSRMHLQGQAASIIASLVVLSLLLGLAVFWLYVSAWLSFVIPALLLDKTSIPRSFRRSHSLSRGSRGRLLLMFILTVVLTLAFDWTLRIPGYILFGQPRQAIPLELWSDGATFIARVLSGPIATISIAVFYIDQRVRKEAFDLQLMMEAIGQATPEQPVAATAVG
jgi:hypothetical protein